MSKYGAGFEGLAGRYYQVTIQRFNDRFLNGGSLSLVAEQKYTTELEELRKKMSKEERRKVTNTFSNKSVPRPSLDITLRRVGKGKDTNTIRRKTLVKAQEWAELWVGAKPRLDPNGYAVGKDGVCVFFGGVTFKELWPKGIEKL